MGANEGGWVWNQFVEPGWVQGECGMEVTEIGKDGMDGWGKLEAGGIGRSMEGSLEVAEEAPGAQKGKGHGLELTQCLVPLGNGDASLGRGNAIEEFEETGTAVGGG